MAAEKQCRVFTVGDTEGCLRTIRADETVKKWIDELYKELEESGDFTDLLKGVEKFNLGIGKRTANYVRDG